MICEITVGAVVVIAVALSDQAEGSYVTPVNQHRSKVAKRASQQNPQTWPVHALVIDTSNGRKTREEQEFSSTFCPSWGRELVLLALYRNSGLSSHSAQQQIHRLLSCSLEFGSLYSH